MAIWPRKIIVPAVAAIQYRFIPCSPDDALACRPGYQTCRREADHRQQAGKEEGEEDTVRKAARLLDALLIQHGFHGKTYTLASYDVPRWPVHVIKERIGEPAEIQIDPSGVVTLTYKVREGQILISGKLGEGNVLENARARLHFS